MGGQEQGQGRSADDSGRVEELILDGLRRIESKVDTGFAEMGRRVTALEVTSGQHTIQLARQDAFSGRLVPWLMLAWNIMMTIIGMVWLVATHLPH